MDEGSSARKATDAGLLDGFGPLRCEDGDCDPELRDLGVPWVPCLNLRERRR